MAPNDAGTMAGFTAGWQAAVTAASGWPLCPNGCGCRLGSEDADARDCACDGLCCYDEIEVGEVFAERDRLKAAIAAQEPKPVPEPSRTEWVVFWGGETPDDCAGWDSRDDEADAEEHREWIAGGGVAQRPVMYGPWTVTVAPPPAERGLLGDWQRRGAGGVPPLA